MLEDELGRMAPDLGVIEEWKGKDAAYGQRLSDLEAATAARNEVWLPSQGCKLHLPPSSHLPCLHPDLQSTTAACNELTLPRQELNLS